MGLHRLPIAGPKERLDVLVEAQLFVSADVRHVYTILPGVRVSVCGGLPQTSTRALGTWPRRQVRRRLGGRPHAEELRRAAIDR